MSKTLLESYQEVDEKIKALTKLKKDLREKIGDLQLGNTIINDHYRLVVTETRSFSPALAQKMLTEQEYAKILKAVPSLDLAKKTLAPQDLDTLYEVKGQTWTIKERDDLD